MKLKLSMLCVIGLLQSNAFAGKNATSVDEKAINQKIAALEKAISEIDTGGSTGIGPGYAETSGCKTSTPTGACLIFQTASTTGADFTSVSNGVAVAEGTVLSGGLGGANELCKLEALARFGGGDYQAFLSTSSQNAKDVVTLERPVLSPLGIYSALKADQLLPASPTGNTIMLSPVGYTGVNGSVPILTGGISDGTVSVNNTCNDWTSTSINDRASFGYSSFDDSRWNSFSTISCDGEGIQAPDAFHIYCVEQVREA